MSTGYLYEPLPDIAAGRRLHLNENTAGCSPKVVEAVRAFDGQRLATYPDFAPFSAWRCDGSCICCKPRFDLDEFARLVIPNRWRSE